MNWLVGMDEAGYGPNLGPLVVAATAWNTSGPPAECEPWVLFEDVLGPPRAGDTRLAVGDSKAVYKAGGSIAKLETSVLAFLQLCDICPENLVELGTMVAGADGCLLGDAPWYQGGGVPLPIEVTREEVSRQADRWREACHFHGMGQPRVGATLLSAEVFNQGLAETNNKAVVLSQRSLALLASLVDPEGNGRTYVLSDKHGGRNRYDEFLSEAFGHRLVMRQQESAVCSQYRVGTVEVLFQPKAERHFPVALASMVAKYIREVAMMCFNTFWTTACPGIKPTRGYPVDARRFRAEMESELDALGIPMDTFWRQR